MIEDSGFAASIRPGKHLNASTANRSTDRRSPQLHDERQRISEASQIVFGLLVDQELIGLPFHRAGRHCFNFRLVWRHLNQNGANADGGLAWSAISGAIPASIG